MAEDDLNWCVVAYAFNNGFTRLGFIPNILYAEACWEKFSSNQSIVKAFANEIGFIQGRKVKVKFNNRPMIDLSLY